MRRCTPETSPFGASRVLAKKTKWLRIGRPFTFSGIGWPKRKTRPPERVSGRRLMKSSCLFACWAWKRTEGEAVVPAEKVFDEAVAFAWKVRDKAVALAQKAYYEAVAPALKVYRETVASARKARDEVIISARKAQAEAEALAQKVYVQAE